MFYVVVSNSFGCDVFQGELNEYRMLFQVLIIQRICYCLTECFSTEKHSVKLIRKSESIEIFSNLKL